MTRSRLGEDLSNTIMVDLLLGSNDKIVDALMNVGAKSAQDTVVQRSGREISKATKKFQTTALLVDDEFDSQHESSHNASGDNRQPSKDDTESSRAQIESDDDESLALPKENEMVEMAIDSDENKDLSKFNVNWYEQQTTTKLFTQSRTAAVEKSVEDLRWHADTSKIKNRFG